MDSHRSRWAGRGGVGEQIRVGVSHSLSPLPGLVSPFTPLSHGCRHGPHSAAARRLGFIGLTHSVFSAARLGARPNVRRRKAADLGRQVCATRSTSLFRPGRAGRVWPMAAAMGKRGTLYGISSPGRGDRIPLLRYITRIKFHSMFLEQRHDFFLIR